MGRFITTETILNKGETGEKIVWNQIRKGFKERECLAYWRYPIFSQSGKFRKEPDILIADLELGLIVIEVKAIHLNQIVNITGHLWQYQNFYTNSGNPYQQAENQLLTLLEYSNREPELFAKITARALLALPYITQQQWQERGFQQLPTNPPILFQEHFTDPLKLPELINNITPLKLGTKLNLKQWNLLLSILAGTPVFCQPQKRVLAPSHSKGVILQKLNQHFSEFDLQQEIIAKQIPPGPQRIRGIPGSGKTVLLCQKAVQMHLKHPDWKIALVFFSRSLYPIIIEQIKKWLHYFSNNQLDYTPDNRNLKILHAWGSKQQPGLYSLICKYTGNPTLNISDLQSKKPNEALAEACLNLLQQINIPQLFDAILIDEGQDLISDQYKYQDKQPFYWLAYQALRPVNPVHPEQRRLIWCYDETQSLDSIAIPTASELFGEKLGHLVTGNYPDQIKKTETIFKCYRIPHLILTAAHGIGMGLLRPEGMLTGITRIEEWQALGYHVKGRFIPGQTITLKRPLENSPHPLNDLWPGELIEFNIYHSRQQELSVLAKKIKSNLRYDGLRPSRDILVIVLGDFFESLQLENHVANFLKKQGIDIFIPGSLSCNLLSQDQSEKNPNIFWYEGAVTIARIFRAKGHEAPMVYLVGFDQIAKNESNIFLRNQLFIALTRSRAWVNLSGIGNYQMYQEMEQVIKSKDEFVFRFTRFPKREIGVTDVSELLRGFSLGRRNFQDANLKNAYLSNVKLPNINLIGANLQGAILRNAQLDGVKLIVSDLSYADLTGASLKKAKLMGANLTKTNLTNADLRGADLMDADLSDAIIRDTLF
jgi:superfamily I DNA and RNA helicase